ncbi:MAG: hypothetical protein ACI376_02410 [Candidatus Bruticola sp.]
MKRLAFAIGAVILICLIAVLSIPNMRRGIFGLSLPLKLQEGRADVVNVVSMLLDGREIRSLSDEPNLAIDDSVQPEVYDLALSFIEKVERGGAQPTLNYLVKEAKLAQIGVNKPVSFLENIFAMRLNPQGAVESFGLIKGRKSNILDEVHTAQLLSSLWIGRPQKRIDVGEVWDSRWTIDYPVDTLKGSLLTLEHRLKYAIVEIRRDDNGMDIAKINYNGSIIINPKSPLPEGTEVLGQGRIEGQAYMNIKDGSVIIADDRTVWVYAVRFLQENMEDLRISDRKSRIFRPRVVPKAGAGFSSAMPQDGAAPNLEQLDMSSQKKVPAASGDTQGYKTVPKL